MLVLLALAAGISLGLGISACGDNSSGGDTQTAPELTVPESTGLTDTEEGTASSPAASERTETVPDENRASTTGSTQGDGERSEESPPRGSAADRFERFCEENPGACD